MRLFILSLCLFSVFHLTAQTAGLSPGTIAPTIATPPGKEYMNTPPSSPGAGRRTRQLYKNLQAMPQKGILFGHQDDLAYGVGWKYIPGESDVKRVAGDYPAVYGWDIAHLENGDSLNIDGVPFEAMRNFIREGYRRGGVITISWHGHNPLTGGSAWDVDSTGAVRSVLPGGEKHALYLSWLDRVADFLQSLRDKGKTIPVLFRPFHELTGSWFWWGEKLCTPEEYKALWRLTVDYLRINRRLDNLLFVYSTAEFRDEAHFLERYPGDDYVDIIGFDSYMRDPERAESRNYFLNTISQRLALLTELGRAHGKPVCFAETGLEQIPVPDWWTKTLWQTINPYPIAYVLLWRNGRPDHYYVPYPGQASAADFQAFVAHDRVLLEGDARAADLYRNRSFWGRLFRR